MAGLLRRPPPPVDDLPNFERAHKLPRLDLSVVKTEYLTIDDATLIRAYSHDDGDAFFAALAGGDHPASTLTPPETPPTPKQDNDDHEDNLHLEAFRSAMSYTNEDNADMESLCSTVHPTPCQTAPGSPMLSFLSDTQHLSGLSFSGCVDLDDDDDEVAERRLLESATGFFMSSLTPPPSAVLPPPTDFKPSSNPASITSMRTSRSSTSRSALVAYQSIAKTELPDSTDEDGDACIDDGIHWQGSFPDSFDPAMVALLMVTGTSDGFNAEQNYVNGIQQLVEMYGSQVCTRTDTVGLTIAHYAAFIGSVPALEFLVQTLGASTVIKQKDAWGNTPLHHAVRKAHHPMIVRLLELGASPRAANKLNITPLYMACETDDGPLLELLLSVGGKLSNRERSRAATDGHSLSIVEMVNEQDVHGRGLLHLACNMNAAKATKVLLHHGAQPGLKDDMSTSPMMLAASLGHSDILDMLLVDKEAVNDVDYYGRTPLHWACANNCLEVVRLLVGKGAAKLEKRDKRGRTPIFLASINRHREVYQHMVAQKATLNLVDYEGLAMTSLP